MASVPKEPKPNRFCEFFHSTEVVKHENIQNADHYRNRSQHQLKRQEMSEKVPLFGNGSLSRGKAYVQEEIVHYFDLDNLDDELFSGGFDYTYDDSKLRLALTGSFRQTNENTREVAGGSFLVLREVTRLGGVGEVRVSAKTKVGVGANFNSTNYKRAGY